jgi:hypothetical protein
VRCSADVIGSARARTDAPDTISAFLRQRPRWFGVFLQTQLCYPHMVGERYGHLGTRMLPVKAFDTMQPLSGLTSIGLLIEEGLAGHVSVSQGGLQRLHASLHFRRRCFYPANVLAAPGYQLGGLGRQSLQRDWPFQIGKTKPSDVVAGIYVSAEQQHGGIFIGRDFR